MSLADGGGGNYILGHEPHKQCRDGGKAVLSAEDGSVRPIHAGQ